MAQDMGLFGPDEYTARMMQEQNALREIQAIDQGGPSVGVGILANRGFGQLRDAVGLEDPAMARGNKMKALVDKLRQAGIDMNDPEQFYPAFIQELQANGFQNEAMAMADKYQKDSLEVGLKSAQIKKYEAEARKALLEKDPEVVRLQKAIAQAKAEGRLEEAAQLTAVLRDKMIKPSIQKITSPGENYGDKVEELVDTNAEGGPKTVYTGKPVQEKERWDEPFETTINGKKVLLQKGSSGNYREVTTGPTSNNTQVNVAATKEFGWVKDGQGAVKDLDDEISQVDRALDLSRVDSPEANEAVVRTLARAFNKGTLTNADVAAWRNNGDLATRFANAYKLFVEGKASQLTQEQRKILLLTAQKKMYAERSEKLAPWKETARVNNLDPDRLFPDRKPPTTGKTIRKTASGVEYEVIE